MVSEQVEIVSVSLSNPNPMMYPMQPAPVSSSTSPASSQAFVTVTFTDGRTLVEPVPLTDASSYVVGKSATLTLTPN